MANTTDRSSPRRTVPAGKRALGKLLLVVGGCLVGLLLGEMGLRLIGFGLGTDSAYQPDAYCGVRHVPNYRGWHTKEGRVWIEINRHGFRDRDRSITKPPDTFRIAVLGDSNQVVQGCHCKVVAVLVLHLLRLEVAYLHLGAEFVEG